ncbi:hypothetical protein [Devosia sp. 2618]|uniref:hypothetical protein n=1 Tax=Devosia sp. 2618 TaxID=3156454 RepID=UPI00339199E6
MTNLGNIVETALLMLAAYLLGCVIGYALRRLSYAIASQPKRVPAVVVQTVPIPVRPAARLAASADETEVPKPLPTVVAVAPAPAGKIITPPKPAAKKPRTKPKAADPKPTSLKAPRAVGADNLKLIKGIGPKIEASLNTMGVFHFDQIATWSKANIDWVDAQLAFKGRIRREKWVEQAVELKKSSKAA